MKTLKADKRSGSVLLVMVCYVILLANWIVVMCCFTSGSRAVVSRKQVDMERAVYAAEAGIECGVAYLMNGGTAPATITNVVAGYTNIVHIE